MELRSNLLFQANPILLLIGLLAIPQLVNISYMEGFGEDFANMALEMVQNSTYSYPSFQFLEMEMGSWALVQVSLPESDYTLQAISTDPLSNTAPLTLYPQNPAGTAEPSINESDIPPSLPSNFSDSSPLPSNESNISQSLPSNISETNLSDSNATENETPGPIPQAGEPSQYQPENGSAIINVSYSDGLEENFSNLLIESSSGNNTSQANFTILDFEQGTWALVNVSATDNDSLLSILSKPEQGGIYPANASASQLNVTYSDGMEADFSNLLVEFGSNGTTIQINHTISSFEPSQWALLLLDRPPLESESISVFASQKHPEKKPKSSIIFGEDFAAFLSAKGSQMEISQATLSLLENNATARVIVKLRQGAFKDLPIAAEAAQRIKKLGKRGLQAMEISQESLENLADAGVERIYPDLPMQISLSDSIPIIQADRVQGGLGSTGEGVAVCLLDTGVDFSLPSLEGKAISGYDFVNNDTDASDDHGHGTLMASIIHAAAPNATILSLKVLHSSGTGYSSHIISAIDYCSSLAQGGQEN